LVVNGTAPAGARLDVVEGFHIAIELPEKVVTQEEIDRTARELEKSRKELESTDARLANEQFVNNAPAAVVEGARSRRAELVARIEKLQQNLQKTAKRSSSTHASAATSCTRSTRWRSCHASHRRTSSRAAS